MAEVVRQHFTASRYGVKNEVALFLLSEQVRISAASTDVSERELVALLRFARARGRRLQRNLLVARAGCLG